MLHVKERKGEREKDREKDEKEGESVWARHRVCLREGVWACVRERESECEVWGRARHNDELNANCKKIITRRKIIQARCDENSQRKKERHIR